MAENQAEHLIITVRIAVSIKWPIQLAKAVVGNE